MRPTSGATGTTVPGVSTNTPAQRSPANTNTASPPAVTTSNANNEDGGGSSEGPQ